MKKFVFAYVKQHRKSLALLLVFAAIFAGSFALYGLPAAAVAYPALLCCLAGAIYAAVDFVRALRRHRTLAAMLELPASMIAQLPPPERVEDADYQAVIRMLQEQAAQADRQFFARTQDMTEYYTVWVHQIKTPISSMRLTLQNEDSPLSRRLSSDLFRIEQYVDMALAYLRLDSTSTDYVFREYGLDSIIRQAVAKFAGEFIDRRIRLDYEPVGQTAVTDEKWLCFVIEQVLSNALKYTRSGSVKIYMRPEKTLCIEDTGVGIAPEDLPRVFEKGYTGCNGRTDKRASGLGLYLCKRICKNLGAQIEVESEPDRGTVVRIDLAQRDIKPE